MPLTQGGSSLSNTALDLVLACSCTNPVQYRIALRVRVPLCNRGKFVHHGRVLEAACNISGTYCWEVFHSLPIILTKEEKSRRRGH